MLVTSTSDGPATHNHSKTYNPMDTTPPTDAQTIQRLTRSLHLPPLMQDNKDTL